MKESSQRVALHLLRHAHAGDSRSWAGPDEERPLTERGRQQAERLGRFLATCQVRPDTILSSPKARALQTAELVAEALGIDVALEPRLGVGYDLTQLERIVKDAGVAAPMLVGHDPDISSVLAELCDGAGLSMRKGALATVDSPRPLRPGSGTLRWLVPPDLLAHL